jgi:hypothetical protein
VDGEVGDREDGGVVDGVGDGAHEGRMTEDGMWLTGAAEDDE